MNNVIDLNEAAFKLYCNLLIEETRAMFGNKPKELEAIRMRLDRLDDRLDRLYGEVSIEDHPVAKLGASKYDSGWLDE